jgi:hypothetical protein
MPDISSVGKLPFEGIDERPANESVVADNGCDCGVDLGPDGLILKLQIRKRYRHSLPSYDREVIRRAGFPA